MNYRYPILSFDVLLQSLLLLWYCVLYFDTQMYETHYYNGNDWKTFPSLGKRLELFVCSLKGLAYTYMEYHSYAHENNAT